MWPFPNNRIQKGVSIVLLIAGVALLFFPMKTIPNSFVIGVILFFSLGYSYGYTKGSVEGIKIAVHAGFLIMEGQNINIDLSEQKISELLFNYKNQINSCEINRKL